MNTLLNGESIELKRIAKWQLKVISDVRSKNFIHHSSPTTREMESCTFRRHERMYLDLCYTLIDQASFHEVKKAVINYHYHKWVKISYLECEEKHGLHDSIP